jgi:hypothetical protein
MKHTIIFLCLLLSGVVDAHSLKAPQIVTADQDSDNLGDSASDTSESGSDKLGAGSGDDSDTANDADPEADQGAGQ